MIFCEKNLPKLKLHLNHWFYWFLLFA